MIKDLYKDLGVTKGATRVEIKKAYSQIVKDHHPNRRIIDDKGDVSKFYKGTHAYKILINLRMS